MWCPPFKSGQVTLVSPHVPVSWIHLVIAIPKIPSLRYLVGPRALETYFLSCVRAPPPAAVLPDAVKFIQSAIQCWVSLKSQPCHDSEYSESEVRCPVRRRPTFCPAREPRHMLRVQSAPSMRGSPSPPSTGSAGDLLVVLCILIQFTRSVRHALAGTQVCMTWHALVVYVDFRS